MRKKYYIGMATTFHDSATAIVDQTGSVLFAEASERYMQDKRAYHLPPDHIFRSGKLLQQYCSPDADFVFAQSWLEPDAEKDLINKKELAGTIRDLAEEYGRDSFCTRRALANLEYLGYFFSEIRHNAGRSFKRSLGIEGRYRDAALSWRYYDHHLSHAATACYTSPFNEAVCLIIDAGGDHDKSYGIFHYKDGKIEELPISPKTPTGSLGVFFSWVCQTCGFDLMANEEWKVMGLAPYGKIDPAIYRLFRDFLELDGLVIRPRDFNQMLAFLKACYEFERAPGQSPLAAADIACTGQHVFEEIYFELIRRVHALGISKNLVMGGGCSLNSTANGKITGMTPFKKLHIYSAPADDGNALGAAWLACHEDTGSVPGAPGRFTPYLGSSIQAESFENLVRFGKIRNMQEYPGEVHLKAAQLLAENKIIGWVQGRAEFGPRALGNRSILASPAFPDIKNVINQRVKFREKFRPFAPSILDEHGAEYFIDYQVSPYMERTLQYKAGVNERIPGVVHANNSGRLQSVRREWNPKYYDLINHFYALTGIPILLNTSLNIMGKPIIHSIEDAIGLFYTTGLDALVVEDFIILK